jgi:hypothetical protein
LHRKAVGENLSIRYGSRTATSKRRSNNIASTAYVDFVRIGDIAQAFVTHIAAYAVKVEIGSRSCSGAALREFAGVEVEVYEEGVSGIEGARNVEF